MTAITRPIRRLIGRSTPDAAPVLRPVVSSLPAEQLGVAVDIPETDPLFAYLQSAPGPVDLTRLELASPALDELRVAGVALVVPLVTQGELIGTLNLGPRLSEQDYSTDDRRLLATLAAQAAPAIRVAQLVREQAAEAAERERFEQELKVAQLIQQQFLPRELPNLPEWQIAAYYGPARVVGGDFYDFIDLGEGRIGVVVGDVTDKGVPAALGHGPHALDPARRGAAARGARQGPRPRERAAGTRDAGAHVRHMPVRRARARDRPLRVRECGSQPALRADRGWRDRAARHRPAAGPDAGRHLRGNRGLRGPGRRDAPVLGRDGRAARPRTRDVRVPAPARGDGNGRRGQRAARPPARRAPRVHGPGIEQEDDITLVTLRRSVGVAGDGAGSEWPGVPVTRDDERAETIPDDAEPLLAFSIEGAIGNERAAMNRVADAVAPLGLEPARLERLKTAVAETVMNAIEYGSQGDPAVPVDVRVDADDATIRVRVTDRALSGPVPDAEMPDLDAKLEGTQKPRGWGLFLIRHMVDGMDVHAADGLQTVTLTLARTPQGGAS